jgi:hypothetical protein
MTVDSIPEKLSGAWPFGESGGVAMGLGYALTDDVVREQLRRHAASLNDGTDFSRVDDHGVCVQVIASISSRSRGSVQATTDSLKFRLSPRMAGSPAPSSAPARARSSEATAPAVVEPEVDVHAQVAVLQQAARDGTPFCEECEKARKQQAAMA